MLGSVGYWFYKALAGINLAPGAAGCDRLRIEPRFVAGLDDADGEYQSVRGVVRCSWQRTAGLVHLSLDIPVNAEADVVIPIDGSTRRVLEGDTPVWDQHGPTGHPDVRVTAQDGETLTMHVGSGHFDLRIVSSSVTRSAAS
jgi:hypothetical protein